MRKLLLAIALIALPMTAMAEPTGDWLQESKEYQRGSIVTAAMMWWMVCPDLELRPQIENQNSDQHKVNLITNIIRKVAYEDSDFYQVDIHHVLLAAIFTQKTNEACSARLKSSKGTIS